MIISFGDPKSKSCVCNSSDLKAEPMAGDETWCEHWCGCLSLASSECSPRLAAEECLLRVPVVSATGCTGRGCGVGTVSSFTAIVSWLKVLVVSILWKLPNTDGVSECIMTDVGCTMVGVGALCGRKVAVRLDCYVVSWVICDDEAGARLCGWDCYGLCCGCCDDEAGRGCVSDGGVDYF